MISKQQSKSIASSLKRLRPYSLLIILPLLGACASKVTVEADIPRPLVEKVPLNIHMSYSEDFKNHVYTESEKRRVLSSMNLAEAQTTLFDTIFGALANLVGKDDPQTDLIIEPEVLDFQYTAPNETKLKQYEIWIKYRLKLMDSAQDDVADWTIKGYGKTPTAMLTSATKAFNSAANVALRDVGAQLATRFAGQKKIKAMIADKTPEISNETNTALAQQVVETPEETVSGEEEATNE